MKELPALLIPFGTALAIYFPPLRRFGFWIASAVSLIMAFLAKGELRWIWGFFAYAFLLGKFAKASPFAAFWAMLSLGAVHASWLSAQEPFSALLLSFSLLLALPAIWEEQKLDLPGASVFLLLAAGPFLTLGLSTEWRLAIILASLLGALPFHLWVRSIMRDGPSFGATLLAAGFRAVILGWLLKEGLRPASGLPQEILHWLGVLSVIWGAFRAAIAEDWGELSAYAATAEAGALLLLAIEGRLEAAFVYSLLAGLGLLALGVGAWSLKLSLEESYPATIAASLLLAGILAVAGLPLTPGFSAQILALNYLAKWEGLLVILSGFGAIAGGARLFRPYALALRSDPNYETGQALILLFTLVLFLVLGFTSYGGPS